MDSTLTVLKALKPSGSKLGKTLTKTKDGWTKSASARVWWFAAFALPVHDLKSLHEALAHVATDDSQCVIMDDLGAGQDPEGVHRRGPNFDRTPKPYILFDLDQLDFAEADLTAAATRARDALPEAFRNAACSVQATSGHMIPLLGQDGLPNACKSKLRLAFWLSRPTNHAENSAWAKTSTAEIDGCIFDAVHIIYTANPTFVGADDPVPARWALLDGEPIVTVPDSIKMDAPDRQHRVKTAPPNVKVNDERAVYDWIAVIDNQINAKMTSSRPNMFRGFAADAHDRAIERSLIEATYHCLIAGDDEDAVANAKGLMHEAGVKDSARLAARVQSIAHRVADTMHKDDFDLVGCIDTQITDAEGYVRTAFGSWYAKQADTDAFSTPDLSEDALQVSDEERAVPAHLAEARAEKAEAKSRVNKPLTSFSAREADELSLRGGSRPLIYGLLGSGTMSIFYGAPSSGKTFIVLDMCLAVAGRPTWNGRKVRNGLVVYVAAEAGRSVFPRISALRRRYPEVDDSLLHLITDPIDLRDPKNVDKVRLIAKVRAIEAAVGQKAVLVVLDTFSRVMAGGDENSSVDMGRMVQVIDAVKLELDAHVMVVHHSGKDAAKGSRGHSLLLGATDTECEVRAEKSNGADGKAIHQGFLEATKQRDLPLELRLPFRLEGVLIGYMEDYPDLAVTSASVKWLDSAEAAEAASTPAFDPAKLTDGRKIVYEALLEALAASGEASASTADIAKLSGGKSNANVTTTLHRMVDLKMVVRVSAGKWAPVKTVAAIRHDPTGAFEQPEE